MSQGHTPSEAGEESPSRLFQLLGLQAPLGLWRRHPNLCLDGHMDSSSVSSLRLPPSSKDAEVASVGHLDNLLITKPLTSSHLQHLSRVPGLGPDVWGTRHPLRPAVHLADLSVTGGQHRWRQRSGRGQWWRSGRRLIGCVVVVGPMVLQRCRVSCRVAVTRAVGRSSAQPVPASSFMISISPGDEDLNQEN